MRLFSPCSKRFFAHRRRFADGRGLLAALRANPSTALIPVIFLSAEAGPEARVDALLHGVDDFLVKVAHSLVKALHADGRLVSPFNLASSSPGSTFICSSARCAANWNGEVRDLPLAQGLRLLTRPFVRSGRADTSTDRERDALPRPRRSLQHALRPISCRHLHDGCRGPDELCVLSLLHPRAITADLSLIQTPTPSSTTSVATLRTSLSQNGATAFSPKICLERRRFGSAQSGPARAGSHKRSTWSSGGVKGERTIFRPSEGC